LYSDAEFEKKRSYNLAKLQFSSVQNLWDSALTAAMLLAGFLPATWQLAGVLLARWGGGRPWLQGDVGQSVVWVLCQVLVSTELVIVEPLKPCWVLSQGAQLLGCCQQFSWRQAQPASMQRSVAAHTLIPNAPLAGRCLAPAQPALVGLVHICAGGAPRIQQDQPRHFHCRQMQRGACRGFPETVG